MTEHPPTPVVMIFAGNDPTGGAGIQADIEAVASMGCHGAPVATAVTVQDTVDVKRVSAVDASLVIEQARAVLEDMAVASFKIGMLGSVDNVEVVHTILMDYPGIPVVLDPILTSGGGALQVDEEIQNALQSLLFPLTTVLTPNSLEARALAPDADNLAACAHEILEQGCEFLLITGTHERTADVVNTLYGNMRELESFTWERLPGNYHGSGCTLASAIAALLAQGLEPFTAIHEAQEYTWQALKYGRRFGMGQHLPNRLYWARSEEDEPEHD